MDESQGFALGYHISAFQAAVEEPNSQKSKHRKVQEQERRNSRISLLVTPAVSPSRMIIAKHLRCGLFLGVISGSSTCRLFEFVNLRVLVRLMPICADS